MKFEISEETEKKFRQAAMKRFGYRKGAFSLAAEEAIKKWTASVEGIPEFKGDPVKAIEGLLADLDIDSVELQHLAADIWAGGVGSHVLDRYKRVSRSATSKVKKRRV